MSEISASAANVLHQRLIYLADANLGSAVSIDVLDSTGFFNHIIQASEAVLSVVIVVVVVVVVVVVIVPVLPYQRHAICDSD